jgi:hypothetical protein
MTFAKPLDLMPFRPPPLILKPTTCVSGPAVLEIRIVSAAADGAWITVRSTSDSSPVV